MKVNERLNPAGELLDLLHHAAINLSRLLVICEKYVSPGVDAGYLQELKSIKEVVEYHLVNKTHVH